MDKRSLIFVVALSCAFFGIQAWFDSQKVDSYKIAQAKAQEEAAYKKKELEFEVASRTANVEDLPIVSLFSDAKGEHKVASAIATGDLFLTLSWETEIPSTVYVSLKNNLVPLHLIGKDTKLGTPVFYSQSKSSKISVPSIPTDSPLDLQLITLGKEIRITLGEQRGNTLSLPFHYLEETAIALMQNGNEFLPVGIYNPEMKKVKALTDFQQLSAIVAQAPKPSTSFSKNGEEFYVLENEYQQLVFSTRGGALAEINLPQRSAENKKSIVKEIDIDRQIIKHSPRNAFFPLRPYYTTSGQGQTLHNEGAFGSYYPLLRRPIFDANGLQKTSFPPANYAFNVIGDDPEIANMQYKVTKFEPNLIRFEGKTSQRRIVKTFYIPEEKNGPYCLLMDIQIDGDTRNLWLTSGVPDAELIAASYSPLLKYQITKGKVSDIETIDLPKKEIIQGTDVEPNWISNNNGFLGVIFDPLTKVGPGFRATQISGTELPSRLTLVDPGYQLYPAANYPGYATYLPLKSGSTTFRIFAGPFDENLLKDLDNIYKEPLINYNPDYQAAQSIQGWFSFISEPFAKFLFLLMELFYAITRSWAASIILLTIALRAMMYPLNAWSIRSSIKMQAIAPKVKAVQEKYKKDPRKAQMEVMTLYKESGINPISGCIPMLLQMPFLIGMFYLLKSSFPLRGAPFIPGWIDDLAAPDILFSWGQPLWFFGNEFHLLPVLMGASMFLQQKLTSQLPKDGTPLSEAQKQQKVMGNVMSIVFIFMFYNFPSGLNLYFMFSTLLGVFQQWWMMKKMKPA
jgi:YidC/Oxa1 family membrane protein insertase